jgi:hypothetical protein
MKRRVFAVAVVLILCVTVGTFAAEKKSSAIPWLVSFNSPGTTDLSVGVGYTEFGYGVQGALNLTFGQFDIGPFPLSWGATAVAEFGFTYDMGLGAGVFLTLDWGFDFGSIWKFEFNVGVGPGITLALSGYWSVPFGVGIGQYASWTWWFSNNLGLTVQDVYAYTFMGPDLYAYTLGVQLKL